MTYESDYLAHFGIKGQKWGVRRFQNPDGTLTQEGKDRYSSANGSSKKPAAKKKKASKMSDQELEEGIKRLKMEQQYNQLLAEVSGKPVKKINKQKSGKKKKGDSVLKKVFVAPAVAVAASVMTKKYQKIANRITP